MLQLAKYPEMLTTPQRDGEAPHDVTFYLRELGRPATTATTTPSASWWTTKR